MTRVIDGLVNVDFADRAMPDWMERVKEDYFGGKISFSSPDLGENLEEMDAHGVERAILMVQVGATEARALEFVEARPDRFRVRCRRLQPLRPMPAPAGPRDVYQEPRSSRPSSSVTPPEHADDAAVQAPGRSADCLFQVLR